jgi:uncharacterized repeat protein (TIGR03987 family)
MKPVLIAGTIIVNLALISYTLFIISERKTKNTGKRVIPFLTLGVILDITATICMITGSSNSPFTLHGILGYSALTGMLIDTFLLWKTRLKNGQESPLSDSLHRFSLIVYCWWIAAYITGAMVVMLK